MRLFLSAIAFLGLGILTPAAQGSAQATRLDSLDVFIKAQMAQRQIRGLSLAVIQDRKIVVARGYGVADATSNAPVTTATLFQAGSISKPVAALGALHLVEAGKLSLDGDVNAKLTSWKVPENRFTATEKVTLRRLLSHNAGITVHGFPGYDVSAPMPSLVQVLDGTSPTNTAAIRVDTTPGAIWRYSGGGFTIMQQMMIDVTGKPFPQFMHETVLGPIGMTSSSFEQPLPDARARLTAAGYYSNRSAVRGRWHLYPEMAAAGLWTTATDLAKFAIEIQETLAGRGHGVVSPAMARQYVTEQKGGSGLGIGVGKVRGVVRFGHGGRDEGFDALLTALEDGHGVVVMINANDNSRFMGSVEAYVRRLWGWPNDATAQDAPAATRAVPIDAKRLARYSGYFEAAENNMVTLVANPDGSGMQVLSDGLPDETLLAMDSTRFGSSVRAFQVVFALDPNGNANAVVLRPGEPRERRAPRVVPLPSSLQPTADPDRALSARIALALQAIKQGGVAMTSAADVTPGAKRDFAGGADSTIAMASSATFVGDEDVSGRGIRRHGSEVAKVRMYRLPAQAGGRYLLVHLTSTGQVTDYDIVDR